MKREKGEMEFPAWYGWKNPNTALVNYWNTHGTKHGENLGFTILPLHFWKYFTITKEEFGYNNIRTTIGFGVFLIFWDKSIETFY